MYIAAKDFILKVLWNKKIRYFYQDIRGKLYFGNI